MFAASVEERLGREQVGVDQGSETLRRDRVDVEPISGEYNPRRLASNIQYSVTDLLLSLSLALASANLVLTLLPRLSST